MLNNIHELPAHLDQEKLPEWINDGLLKGGIYALKTQSSAIISLVISQALAENFTRAVECVVVTALPCDEIFSYLHRRNSHLLSDAIESGRLKIFSPVGDYKKNIFRFGPERLLSELDQFCAPRDSLVIFDHADSLFTVEDSEIVAAQADAYRKWMRKTHNIALCLFQDSIELSPGSPYFRSLAGHFSGIAGLYMFRNKLEVGIDFWTTQSGTLLSQPLAIKSNDDGSIEIRPTLAVNRRNRSRLDQERGVDGVKADSSIAYVASTKTHVQDSEELARMAETKDVLSCLRATAFQSTQQQPRKPPPPVNDSILSSPASATDNSDPPSTASPVAGSNSPSISPVNTNNPPYTSSLTNNSNPGTRRMLTRPSQRIAMTVIAFVALGILGIGIKQSWDFATMDVFKSYSHFIEKLYIGKSGSDETQAIVAAKNVADRPISIEAEKITADEVSPSSSTSPDAASRAALTKEATPPQLAGVTEKSAVAHLPQVEPLQQPSNQNRILPNESVRVITSEGCPEQLQALRLCSNVIP